MGPQTHSQLKHPHASSLLLYPFAQGGASLQKQHKEEERSLQGLILGS